MTVVGPGDLVLNKTSLLGLSLWNWQSQGEITIALQKSWFCWYVVLVKCKSLIRVTWFLPTYKFVGKGVFWVSHGIAILGLTFSATLKVPSTRPILSFLTVFPEYKPSSETRLIALSLKSPWLFLSLSFWTCFLPYLECPLLPFCFYKFCLTGEAQLSSHLLSSELMWHFSPYHAMDDITTV